VIPNHQDMCLQDPGADLVLGMVWQLSHQITSQIYFFI